MKDIPDDSLSASMESLAFVFIYYAKLINMEGRFNWDNRELQDFIHSNNILFTDSPSVLSDLSNQSQPNYIYMHPHADKAFAILFHIKNGLVKGSIADRGYDYEIWDMESLLDDRDSETSPNKASSPSQRPITFKAVIRKHLFWQLVKSLIKSAKL